MNAAEQLYQSLYGVPPERTEPLSPAGSNRQYFRLTGSGNSVIGVIGTSFEENRAFLYMAQHFQEKGLPVPKLLRASADQMAYLQEDLGDTLLFDFIRSGRETGEFSSEETTLLKTVIRSLAVFQVKAAEDFDWSVCYPQPAFNLRSVMWDLNYFKYCFLKGTGVEFQEDRLEDDFCKLADRLLQADSDCFLYRDFQSRNVMIHEGTPYFIDFQGGRKGPLYYDVASFLWQAKANFPLSLREELIDEYLEELKKYKAVNKADFRDTLTHFVLFRTLQVLGAYGYRGYFERKPHFLESIPFALRNVKEMMAFIEQEYQYLGEILYRVIKAIPAEVAKATPANLSQLSSLQVTIYSFSYKKGIPEDTSGNGGGFVFDCRAIHNPGKYEEYKQLTGSDQPVIDFLERDGEILRFLEHVHGLVDASVERYLKRGFSHLQVSFGCTGGQHRSLYAAEHTAEHIHNKYGVRVRLIHREQEKERVLE